jgi:hypothetical protein
MVAGQGNHQQACEVGPDQEVQSIGDREALLGIDGCAMGDQEPWTPGDDAVLNCDAHGFTIALNPRRLHP